MAAENNTPVGRGAPGGSASGAGDDDGPAAGTRRTLGLIFGLVLLAALLIVAAVMLRK